MIGIIGAGGGTARRDIGVERTWVGVIAASVGERTWWGSEKRRIDRRPPRSCQMVGGDWRASREVHVFVGGRRAFSASYPSSAGDASRATNPCGGPVKNDMTTQIP